MDFGIIVFIWIAIMILDNIAKRKKRRIPPQQNDSPDFDIPTLPNDPNFPGEEIILVDRPTQAEVRPKDLTSPRQRTFNRQTKDAESTNELDLDLTPSTVVNAFVIAELLDKPKALRRGRR